MRRSPIVTNYTYYQNSQGRNSQLLQSDGTNSYAWDNHGNLLTKGTINYTWDYDDRLAAISGGAGSAAYVYDYRGERIKKTVGGVETGYLYQAEDIVKETSGGTVTDYLHGIGIDDPVMLDRSGAKSYYFGDGLGSIREMTDTTGTVQNSYSYGAWGELRASSATVANSYGYTGREFAEEGLYYYRARYLDPGLGRFISSDPIGLIGGMNVYIYVNNDPPNSFDPFGFSCVSLAKIPIKVSSHSTEPSIDWSTYRLVHYTILAEVGGPPPILYYTWKRTGRKTWEVEKTTKWLELKLCCCLPIGCEILETYISTSIIVKKTEEITERQRLMVFGVSVDSDFLQVQLCIKYTNPNRGDIKLGN